ncbi:MAG: DUF6690 family protein [Pirellulales bacterium]
MIRNILFLLFIGSFIGIFWTAFSGTGQRLFGRGSEPQNSTTDGAVAQTMEPVDHDVPRVLSDPSNQGSVPSELAPVKNLGEVLDFRITPPWVLGNWPIVTTGLRSGGLFGYRVPLVSGTTEQGVTGSLTYYFTPSQRLERIELLGDTGDARQLVKIVTETYGLRRAITKNNEFIYRRSAGEQVVSELQIRTSTVVRSAAPYHRFSISMILSRPDNT